MTADEIITAARLCLRTPFLHQGRQVGIGLDCAGLAVQVARSLGCEVIDMEGYGREPTLGMLETMLDAQPYLERVTDNAGQPGDLLLMRFVAAQQHLAILAGETMIHAWEAPGLCCEHDIDAAWRARIVQIYRFVGVGA